MNIGAIITHAIEITWKRKVLWLLGFLVALGGEGIGRIVQGSQMSYEFDANSFQRSFGQIPDAAILVGITLLLCLLVVLSAVFWVLAIIARGGLIAGVQSHEVEGSVSLRNTWKQGVSRFWSLLGLNVLLYLPVIVLGLVVVIGLLFGLGVVIGALAVTSPGRGNSAALGIIGVTLVVLCVFAMIGIVIGALIDALRVFGERAIVLEDYQILPAVSRGWRVFWANLSNIISLALLMWAISIVFGIITLIVGLALILPASLPLIDEIRRHVAPSFGSILLVIGSIVLVTFLSAVINTLFITMNSAAWTLAYRQFTAKATSTPATHSALAPG